MAYKPRLDWHKPAPCQCCGGKKRMRIDQVPGLMPGRWIDCPDCKPAGTAVMAQWPGGIGEQVEF
jgi:hypothetical protein